MKLIGYRAIESGMSATRIETKQNCPRGQSCICTPHVYLRCQVTITHSNTKKQTSKEIERY